MLITIRNISHCLLQLRIIKSQNFILDQPAITNFTHSQSKHPHNFVHKTNSRHVKKTTNITAISHSHRGAPYTFAEELCRWCLTEFQMRLCPATFYSWKKVCEEVFRHMIGNLGLLLPPNSLDLGTPNTKTTRWNLGLTPHPQFAWRRTHPLGG